MTADLHLTSTAFLAEAARLLEKGGYSVRRQPPGFSDITVDSLLAEDAYGVLAVLLFATTSALLDRWAQSQGVLVDAMSENLKREDPKSWDGYLLLATLEPVPPEQEMVANAIRNDAHQVRKFVVGGANLRSLADIEQALTPLLPLDIGTPLERSDAILDSLPSLLSRRGIQAEYAEAVLGAFRRAEPLLDALDRVVNR